MDNIIKPKKLKIGATVGFLTVSGAIKDQKELLVAKQNFENAGYKVKVSQTSFSQKNYLCADDNTRAKAFNDFFSDDEIDAVICTRGGYGAIRILDKIDYELIKKHPKIFCGFSDITAFLWMIYKKTGMVSFHGAHAISTFLERGFTQNSFWQVMEENMKSFCAKEIKTYNKGSAKGVLLGGNLCTLSSLCGSDFIPDKDFILFLEDINEPVYKIDRMFTQLCRSTDFTKYLKGIILGGFGEIDYPKSFEDFWSETSKSLNLPVCGGFEISHEENHLVLPYGIEVNFNAQAGKVEFLENYFCN